MAHRQRKHWIGIAGVYNRPPAYEIKCRCKTYDNAVEYMEVMYDLDPHHTAKLRKYGYLNMNVDEHGTDYIQIDYMEVYKAGQDRINWFWDGDGDLEPRTPEQRL